MDLSAGAEASSSFDERLAGRGIRSWRVASWVIWLLATILIVVLAINGVVLVRLLWLLLLNPPVLTLPCNSALGRGKTAPRASIPDRETCSNRLS
jgi:hypothetical protein